MKRSLIALALASLLPLAAQANDRLSYTYVEGDYVNIDGDGGFDSDGYALRGSFALGTSGLYTFGGYQRTDVDGTNIDGDGHEFGLGYGHGISDNSDLIAEIAHQRTDYDIAKIDGFRTSVGLRSALGERFEGLLKANYYDGSDYSGDFTGTVGLQFKLNQTWGITSEAEFGDGADSYLVGVRASY
jgi:Ax21 family sulfation-dependent quorum factor